MLNGSALTHLPQNAIKNLPMLQNLTIANSNLKWIHDRSIKPNLIQFNLIGNQLNEFPNRAPPSTVEIFKLAKHNLLQIKLFQIRQLNDKVCTF